MFNHKLAYAVAFFTTDYKPSMRGCTVIKQCNIKFIYSTFTG